MPAHKTVQTPLPMAGAMGITKYLFSGLGVRGLGVAEGLVISSLTFSQVAFHLIRRPFLFDQNLPAGFLHLFGLFLTSPMAAVTLGGLVLGYLVTGVVLPGKELPERWNIRQTLMATGIAVGGGLVSVVPMTLGLLHPNPWGYGLIAVGFFLGPWLRAQFHPRADRSAAPSHEVSSSLPKRRHVLRSLLFGVPSVLGLGTVNLLSLLSVGDNEGFLRHAKADAAKFGFPEDPSGDKSLRVARLSSGLIRYRVMNPQGRNLVLGFHGLRASLEIFPTELETTLKKLDIQGIFLDRPGMGPVSTFWPGHDFADWADLVEEFIKKELNNQHVSIIGHSAGGVLTLACAKLARVKALALVSTPTPMTIGSLLRAFHHHDQSKDPAMLVVEFLPSMIIPIAQQFCQQILHDWPSYFKEFVNMLGPVDKMNLTQNENAYRKNTVTSIMQGAKPMIEDIRVLISPWLLTPADTERLPILIFRGAGDRVVRPSVAQELQTHFAPNALLFPPFEDMGHFPALTHYELIFAELAKLLEEHARLDVQRKRNLLSAAS
jgi:pimeloyl-ACP methyl ester carboxylesterase